jgi:glycosyltransferase involved in cell wall biosynthesis
MDSLSILLPVYNWPIGEVVTALYRQCARVSGLAFEILVFDDASPDLTVRAANQAALAQLPAARYEVLPQNVGRAAIRNQLAAAARYPWLLFLDGDSGLPDDAFIERYRAAVVATPATSAWIGGTCYHPTPPAEASWRLRWLYGRAREQRTAAERQQAPYAAFTLNNLLIQRETYLQFGLDESLGRTYGHEDTALGGALAAAQVSLGHLDNPVLHLGLEPAPAFLSKTREAVQNLIRLGRLAQPGATASRLWQTVTQLRRWHLSGATLRVLEVLEARLLGNLTSAAPLLRVFDLWRLLLVLRALRDETG